MTVGKMIHILFLAFSLSLCQAVQAEKLVLEEPEKNVTLCIWNINEGAEISLSYTHSLYGVQQCEEFRMIDGSFFLAGVCFGSYDAALYYNDNPSGGIQYRADGYYISEGKYLSEIFFKLAGCVRHVLRIDNETVDLYAVAAAGAALRLSIKP